MTTFLYVFTSNSLCLTGPDTASVTFGPLSYRSREKGSTEFTGDDLFEDGPIESILVKVESRKDYWYWKLFSVKSLVTNTLNGCKKRWVGVNGLTYVF